MQKGLEKLLKVLIKKYSGKFGKENSGKNDWLHWQNIGQTYKFLAKGKQKSAGGIMQNIVKDYFDGVEKVFKSNIKQVQDILTRYMQRRRTDSNWDEIVTNDFKIKKVWIIEDADELMPGDAEKFKSNISLQNYLLKLLMPRTWKNM